ITLVKRDGTIFDVNRLTRGFTKEMVIGQNVFNENFHETEDQRESVRTAISDLIESGEITQFETSQLAPDGSFASYETKVSPFGYDEEGRILSFQFTIRDITERKKAEKELIDLQKKNRAWFENSPICTKILDIDFNLQYMSASGIRDLQIDDITQHYGKPYPFYFYPDSFKNQMTGNLRKAKETGQIIEQEASVVDTEGNELWYHSTIVPVRDNKDQFEYIIVVSVETTKRKQAEEALKESEKNLRVIMENTPDHIMRLDKNLIIKYINFTAPDLTIEDVIGKSVFDFVPEESKNIQAEAYKKVLSLGEPVNFETLYIDKSGNKHFYEVRLAPVFTEDEVSGIINRSTDITERKISEQKLKESEEEFRKIKESYERLTDNADVAIFRVKIKGRDIIYSIPGNPAAERLFGYSKAEWLSDPTLGFKIIHPDFVEKQKQIMDDINKNKKPIKNAVLGWIAKDGHEVIMEYTIIPILDDNSDIVYFESIGVDITERKKAEQKLKESEEKWKALSENSPALITLFNREHKIVFINHTVPDLTKEEVIGTSVYTFIPQEFHQLARNSFNSVWETGEPVSYSTNYITKEGDTRFFDNWIGPVFQSGKIFALVSHSMDVTEKKDAEIKLKESEEKYNNLFQYSNDAILLHDF
ncbi:hypothetical protein LCGC14_2160830, partial [marine sediment metagenome]